MTKRDNAPHPTDYVTPDQIQDLWGIGYTIVKRDCGRLDIFELPNGAIPAGRAYQWFHLVQDKQVFERSGWAPVPASRHEGWFMPFGHVGQIEVSGLGLFDKPKHEVDAERAQIVHAAKQQVSDWAKKTEADGISGSFKIDGQVYDVGDQPKKMLDPKSKSINTTVGVPADMFPHMADVFAERDRLYAGLQQSWDEPLRVLEPWQDEVMKKIRGGGPTTLKGPALNALLLPYAVENVRKTLPTPMLDKLKAMKEGKTDE